MAACACCNEEYRSQDDNVSVTIRFDDAMPSTKAALPAEDLVSDICLLIFDEDGDLEKIDDSGSGVLSLSLSKGRSYSFFAYANSVTEVHADGIDDVLGLKHRLRDPYDYRNGIPMSAQMTGVMVERDTSFTMELERLMSKISVRMDRSALSEGTEIIVKEIRIGNCPAEAYLFRQSGPTSPDECFDAGFEREDVEMLNRSDRYGMSGAVSLYMLENMQGDHREDGKETIMDKEDPRREISSYVEIDMEYKSDSLYCTDEPLTYRFYIGDPPDSQDVERNCHYHIVIRPEDDGLPEDGWRVDKGGLHTYVQSIDLSHEEISMNYIGQTLQIEASVWPLHAYIQDLSWESSDDGIATVDDEGMVTAISEGTCFIYCKSIDGSGISESCPVDIEFDPPYFKSYPAEKYIRGGIGDTLRIWCDIFPPYTPFDIGKVYLEADRKDGIYDFIIDDDGHGVTLILKGPGTGLIYMEAGDPVNEAEMYLIEVNLPENRSLSDNAPYGNDCSP